MNSRIDERGSASHPWEFYYEHELHEEQGHSEEPIHAAVVRAVEGMLVSARAGGLLAGGGGRELVRLSPAQLKIFT